jgi:hypothetical protein
MATVMVWQRISRPCGDHWMRVARNPSLRQSKLGLAILSRTTCSSKAAPRVLLSPRHLTQPFIRYVLSTNEKVARCNNTPSERRSPAPGKPMRYSTSKPPEKEHRYERSLFLKSHNGHGWPFPHTSLPNPKGGSLSCHVTPSLLSSIFSLSICGKRIDSDISTAHPQQIPRGLYSMPSNN